MPELIHDLAEYQPTNPPPVHSTPFYVAEDLVACLVTLQPGAIVPPHAHDHHAEIFDVIEGEGIFILGEQRVKLKPGMTICVPAQVQHSLQAGSQPWILRETVHYHIYARQALKRAFKKRWAKLWGS